MDTIADLFDFASCFAYKNYCGPCGDTKVSKIPDGDRVAIITNAGGPGIVATDVTISSGMTLAHFSEDTVAALESHLPAASSLHNPVDVIGDATQDRYENALAAVIRDENVDCCLVILTPQSMTNVLGTAQAVTSIARRTHKPILCVFMGIVDVSEGVRHLQENGVPTFRFPEAAARALGVLYRYSKWLNRPHLAQFHLTHDRQKASAIINECLKEGRTHLGELDGLKILACYGFKTLPTELATSEEEAVALAERFGFPVVLKIVSPQILHKSDAGGVKVGLEDAEAVRSAFRDIIASAKAFSPTADIQGVLVQALASPGREIILGANRYPVFGPLIMFGLGGVAVEIFKDVAFRLAPIARNEARRMMREVKSYGLLKEFRGSPAGDEEAVERMLVSLSDMVVNHPEIKELDINPLLVHARGKGATVADCRIILEANIEELAPAVA